MDPSRTRDSRCSVYSASFIEARFRRGIANKEGLICLPVYCRCRGRAEPASVALPAVGRRRESARDPPGGQSQQPGDGLHRTESGARDASDDRRKFTRLNHHSSRASCASLPLARRRAEGEREEEKESERAVYAMEDGERFSRGPPNWRAGRDGWRATSSVMRRVLSLFSRSTRSLCALRACFA